MVNKKWVAIAYCCIFISIYFLNLAYATSTFILLKNFQIETPQTYSLNSTNTGYGVMSMGGGEGTIIFIFIAALISVIIFFMLSHRAMAEAY